LESERDRKRRGDGSKYKTFKATYRDDPAAFVMDCIDWTAVRNSNGPADYQIEILSEIPRSRRVSARGPHGLGKTTIEAWVILWFALTSDGEDWKAITTASAWRQLTLYLWPEVHKWSRSLRWDLIGRAPFADKAELLDRNLKLETGAASSAASNDHAKIEGAHADRLLFAYDEAKVIPNATWDASDGAFSTGECYGLAVSTPGPPVGRFFDIHSKKPGFEHWWVKHVTLDDAIRAGRVSAQWAEEMKGQWGEDSALYRNRVLGEFAESAADGIIPLVWVEAANDRWYERRNDRGPIKAFGVDVGEVNDPTVFAPLYANDYIGGLTEHEGKDSIEVADLLRSEIAIRGGDSRTYSVVDAIGIGSGVVAALRHAGARVVAFVASERSVRKDKTQTFGFVNKRAEMWWNLREMLDPGADAVLALPPDPKLLGELTTPKYHEAAGAKIAVESKDDIRKRLQGRSTDRADAVCQVCNERPPNIGEGIISVSKRRSPRRKSVWRGGR
jgi:hypothetical protein